MGRLVPIEPSKLGTISLSLTPGEHQVEFTFGDTLLRYLAKMISRITIALVIMLLLLPRLRRAAGSRKQRRNASPDPA